MFSNVVHIESLLRGIKDVFPDRFVARAFDIHRRERPKAMADLALMNVTAASLFQGLEGLFKFFAELHHPGA